MGEQRSGQDMPVIKKPRTELDGRRRTIYEMLCKKPDTRGAACAMLEHQGQATRVFNDLIEKVEAAEACAHAFMKATEGSLFDEQATFTIDKINEETENVGALAVKAAYVMKACTDVMHDGMRQVSE